MGEDVAAVLQKVPLFESLSSKEMKSLSALGKEVQRTPGEAVTTEGEGGVAFFVITEGSADVSVGGVKQRTIGPGDYFGEISLIDGGPRTATVTALEPMRLIGLTAWSFKPLLDDNPDMTWKVMLGLCKMVRVYAQT